jgi:hypothetical protein
MRLASNGHIDHLQGQHGISQKGCPSNHGEPHPGSIPTPAACHPHMCVQACTCQQSQCSMARALLLAQCRLKPCRHSPTCSWQHATCLLQALPSTLPLVPDHQLNVFNIAHPLGFDVPAHVACSISCYLRSPAHPCSKLRITLASSTSTLLFPNSFLDIKGAWPARADACNGCIPAAPTTAEHLSCQCPCARWLACLAIAGLLACMLVCYVAGSAAAHHHLHSSATWLAAAPAAPCLSACSGASLWRQLRALPLRAALPLAEGTRLTAATGAGHAHGIGATCSSAAAGLACRDALGACA